MRVQKQKYVSLSSFLKRRAAVISVIVCLSIFIIFLVLFCLQHLYEKQKLTNTILSSMSSQTSKILPYLLLPEQSIGIELMINKIQKEEGAQSIKVITPDSFYRIYDDEECTLVGEKVYACGGCFSSMITFIGEIKAAGIIYGYLVKQVNIKSLLRKDGMIYLAVILTGCLILFQYGTYALVKKLSTKHIPANITHLLDVVKSELRDEKAGLSADNLFLEFHELSLLIKKLIIKYHGAQRKAAIGQLTSMLAHDVRKPFSIVKSVLDMFDLFKNGNIYPNILEKARIDIERSISHVESMIYDIMDFSRDMKFKPTAQSIIPLIDFSIRQVAQSFQNADIHFRYNLSHTNQPLADDERMARVVTNILENGIEAILHIAKRNSGTIDISTEDCIDAYASENDICITHDRRFVRIVLGNDGPALNNEDIPKLFKPFFTKGKKMGSGIGLASAQRIVALHEGTIEARNKLDGNGVEFIITIPASKKLDSVDQTGLPATLNETLFTEIKMDGHDIDRIIRAIVKRGEKYKILLLEDEGLYRASVRNTIKRYYDLDHLITLYEAHNVKEAMAILKKEEMTHAIVDIDLSEVENGFDFLKEAKAQFPFLKCIVHSNHCSEKDKQRSIDLRAMAFVLKPLNIEHLIELL